MRLFYSLPLIALLTAVASLNANAASFDCAKASTVVEGSVCANANLSKLDEALFDVYFRATLTRPADKQELMAEQRSWLGLRNNCGANVDCLTTAYQKRIEHLEKSLVPKATNNAIQALNGNWYSAQWKYGYTLQNGVGVATSTNSPNFKVGQNILQLTPTAPNKFSGQQVYTDGKFYNVTATLQPDGSLYFEGDKNVKWSMTRIGNTNNVPASTTTETYEDGRSAHKAKDYVTAMRIYTALANKNDARAQTFIGLMYGLGEGVAKDDVQANKWYQLAAENGFASAQRLLGYQYKRGIGVEQNFNEALKWFRLAAAQGNASAQFELGLMYQMGQGVATNDAEAIKWYQLAAAQGNEQAKKSLDVLRPAVATAPAAAPQQSPPAATAMPPVATTPAPSTQPATISSGHKLIISKTDCKQWLGTMPNSSRLTFSIENQTTNNYSELVGKYVIKDAKNKLIKQGNFMPGRIRPQSVAGYELTDGDMSCNEMASFEITSISPITAIDGVVVRISGDNKGTEKITDDILRGITINWKTSQPVASSTPAPKPETSSAPALKRLMQDGFCAGYLTGAVRFKEDVTPRPITNRMERALTKNKTLAQKIDTASQNCAARAGASEEEIKKSLSCYENSFSDSEEKAFAIGVQRGLVLTFARTPTAFDAKTACADFD
jgi:uncharacterized protein